MGLQAVRDTELHYLRDRKPVFFFFSLFSVSSSPSLSYSYCVVRAPWAVSLQAVRDTELRYLLDRKPVFFFSSFFCPYSSSFCVRNPSSSSSSSSSPSPSFAFTVVLDFQRDKWSEVRSFLQRFCRTPKLPWDLHRAGPRLASQSINR